MRCSASSQGTGALAGIGAIVKCSSQDIFALRDRIGALLDLPKDRVQVQYLAAIMQRFDRFAVPSAAFA
jgi:hypothetical protein